MLRPDLASDPAAHRIGVLLLRPRHAAALAAVAAVPDLDEGRELVISAESLNRAGAAVATPGVVPVDLAAAGFLNTRDGTAPIKGPVVCRLK